jgi:hypothetical protein
MPDRKMILPVVGKRLVEGPILLLSNVARVTRPDRLRLVEFLIHLSLLLDLLFLFVLSLFLIIVIDLLDLGLSLFVLTLFDLLLLVILDLLRHVIRDH